MRPANVLPERHEQTWTLGDCDGAMGETRPMTTSATLRDFSAGNRLRSNAGEVTTMLHQTCRVVLGVFLALMVFAGSAAAECAWILWGRQLSGDPLWTVINGFKSEEECGRAAESRLRLHFGRNLPLTATEMCLPD